MKVVIVGGVAGGATAATRIRRLDESAEIIVIERSGFISYANCGLPYYIGGVIEDPEDLTLQTPESFMSRYRIDVRIKQEVTEIDADSKKIIIKDINSGREYEETYDKLLLSMGAKPVRPAMPGIDNERVFSLRTVEDTFTIKDYVDTKKPVSAVVVGGGFIGLEMAENLCERGIKVTIIQKPDHVMNTLDYDMATQVHAKLRMEGITIITGCNVTRLEENGNAIDTYIDNKCPVTADMVIMAVGVSPETTLAKEAGIKLGIKGSIVVNDKMETSVPDIYAVGDAVSVKHFITENDALIALAGPANKQGRIAADNICGYDSRYKGSMGTSVMKLFDMTVAGTGLTERVAKDAGINYDKVVLSPSSHAGYYPDAHVMIMKLLYDAASLKILGAQIVGYDGVDKRIDVIATAISAGMKADMLKDLELAYAPPFSSAKDPVNMAGFMIENISTGKIKQVHWDELCGKLEDRNITFLDTRNEFEYEVGHVEGFVNIPLNEIRDRMDEIDKSKPVYVMCQSGLRSYLACRILMQNGFDCYNFSGGYRFYESVVNERIMAKKAYPCGMNK